MISLDTIQSELHSIQIKDAAGDALAISAGGAALIEAVDLDIRDLAFATDKVDVTGSEVSLDSATLAALENINAVVTATDLDIRDLSHTQDSVKVGDGTDFLAINADGSINVQAAEAGYASWKVSTATVGLTEVQLVASPLTGRLRVEIQNLGTKDVWIREITGVSTSNGLKIPKGSSFEQALDAGATIFAISNGASADLRIAEYAA